MRDEPRDMKDGARIAECFGRSAEQCASSQQAFLEAWPTQEPDVDFAERTLEQVLARSASRQRSSTMRRLPRVRLLLVAVLISVGSAAAWNMSELGQWGSAAERHAPVDDDRIEKTAPVRLVPAITSTVAAPHEGEPRSTEPPVPERSQPRVLQPPASQQTTEGDEASKSQPRPTHYPSCFCGPGGMVCGCTDMPESDRPR